jgi:hypothetical protein
MRTTFVAGYILGGLLLVIADSHTNSQLIDGKYRSNFRKSKNFKKNNITLPPDFVVIIDSIFTLYYQFDANASAINSTVTTASTKVNNATNSFTNKRIISNESNSSTIDLYMVFEGHHRFALGFGINDTITDLIVCDIVNDTIVVSDQHFTENGLPMSDTDKNGTNDVTLVDYFMNSTTMLVHVTRLQNTSDPLDFAFNGPGKYSMKWVYNPRSELPEDEQFEHSGLTTATLLNTNGRLTNDTQQLKNKSEGGHGDSSTFGYINARWAASLLVISIWALVDA